MRATLFSTCLAGVMFSQATQVIATLPKHLGHEVVLSGDQVYRRQMHTDTGYLENAARITHNHARTFGPMLGGQWSATVVPSGSCTGTARHEQKVVAEHVGDKHPVKQSQRIAGHVYDLTELITDVLGLEDVSAHFLHAITYHPTYHSLRIAEVGGRPYRLLRTVEGLTLVDLSGTEVRCSFDSTFAMKNPETSTSMPADRVANVISTHAEVLVMGDCSCLICIGGNLSHLSSGIRPVRLAEILASTKGQSLEDNISFAPENTQAIWHGRNVHRSALHPRVTHRRVTHHRHRS